MAKKKTPEGAPEATREETLSQVDAGTGTDKQQPKEVETPVATYGFTPSGHRLRATADSDAAAETEPDDDVRLGEVQEVDTPVTQPQPNIAQAVNDAARISRNPFTVSQLMQASEIPSPLSLPSSPSLWVSLSAARTPALTPR